MVASYGFTSVFNSWISRVCQAIMEFHFVLMLGNDRFFVVNTALSVIMEVLHRVKLKIMYLGCSVYSLFFM